MRKPRRQLGGSNPQPFAADLESGGVLSELYVAVQRQARRIVANQGGKIAIDDAGHAGPVAGRARRRCWREAMGLQRRAKRLRLRLHPTGNEVPCVVPLGFRAWYPATMLPWRGALRHWHIRCRMHRLVRRIWRYGSRSSSREAWSGVAARRCSGPKKRLLGTGELSEYLPGMGHDFGHFHAEQ